MANSREGGSQAEYLADHFPEFAFESSFTGRAIEALRQNRKDELKDEIVQEFENLISRVEGDK